MQLTKMKNDEESTTFISDKDGGNLLQDELTLQINRIDVEHKIRTSFASRTSTAFSNPELNEKRVTLENETLAVPSASNLETAFLSESEEGSGICGSEKMQSISKLKCSYDELQAKWEMAQVQRINDQAEIDRLKSQMESQIAFSLNIGAVLGNLVWRASCEPEVISLWFTQQSYQKKVGEFVSIADRIIEIFFNTYEEEFPPYSTDEYQFVRGLLGTVVNMAVLPEGRNFLNEHNDGRNLLKNLVHFLPRIQIPKGVPLMRSLILILWNMCVNKSVLAYLFELHIGKVVAHCIDESNPEMLRLLGFELLLSITYNLADPKCLDDIFKYVSIENIRRFADSGEDKVATMAQRFLDLTRRDNIASLLNNHHGNK